MSDPEPEGVRTREDLFEHLKDLQKSISLQQLTDILGVTIKHDNGTKVVMFLATLLTYTDKDQINVGLLAESSTGKSYIPDEITQWYFPKEDVIAISYASPTAFFHEVDSRISEWETDPTDTRDVEEDKKRKIHHINLERKILEFRDQPHDQLLQRLRSFLSHDNRHLEYKITDKKTHGQLTTKTTILDGFATVIFCSANYGKMEDQEKTRLLLLSPEVTYSKVWDSVAYRIEKKCNSQAHQKFLEDHPDMKWLANRVRSIKTAKISNIIVPPELENMINERFKEKREKHTSPRYMRDIDRLIGLIDAWTLFNFNQRKRLGNDLIATEEDVLMGFQLYEMIGEANEYGLSPEVYDIFKMLITDLNKCENRAATRTEFQQWYRTKFARSIGRERAAQILKTLDTSGLVTEESSPTDKRTLLYTLIPTEPNENNVSSGLVPPFLTMTDLLKEKRAPCPTTHSFTIKEVRTSLRDKLQGSFKLESVYDIIKEGRKCDDSEAKKLFDQIVREGEVFLTVEGLWRWT